jgi:uncharacterized protein with gpF-like domain
MAAKSRNSADDKSNQTNAFRSAIGYAKNVAREFRDVPTAVANGVITGFKRGQGAKPGSKALQNLVDNDTRANWNARKQYKEALESLAGKKGTRSDQVKGNKYINKTPKKK